MGNAGGWLDDQNNIGFISIWIFESSIPFSRLKLIYENHHIMTECPEQSQTAVTVLSILNSDVCSNSNILSILPFSWKSGIEAEKIM